MTYKMRVTIDDIIHAYSQKHMVDRDADISRAYTYAAEKQSGVFRGTGEPYINHALRAMML